MELLPTEHSRIAGLILETLPINLKFRRSKTQEKQIGTRKRSNETVAPQETRRSLSKQFDLALEIWENR